MKDLGKILTRISDNLGKILASMARLNNLGKILIIKKIFRTSFIIPCLLCMANSFAREIDKFFCDFEDPNSCQWIQDIREDDFDWTRNQGHTKSGYNRPTADHTKSFGLLNKKQGPGSIRHGEDNCTNVHSGPCTRPEEGAFLVTGRGCGEDRLEFRLMPNGILRLTRYGMCVKPADQVTEGAQVRVFSSCDVTDTWNWTANRSLQYREKMCLKLDDVKLVLDSVCDKPRNLFEFVPTSGWYLYIEYIEASNQKPNGTARLISPSTTKAKSCLIFFYHMFGANVGELQVYVKSGGKMGLPVWRRSGDQGDKWLQAHVPANKQTASYKFVIEGVRGEGDLGHIAIDDISLMDSCPRVSTTPGSSPSTTSSEDFRGNIRDPGLPPEGGDEKVTTTFTVSTTPAISPSQTSSEDGSKKVTTTFTVSTTPAISPSQTSSEGSKQTVNHTGSKKVTTAFTVSTTPTISPSQTSSEVEGRTDDSSKIIITATIVAAGVFLSIVLNVLLVKYKRQNKRRASKLSTPDNFPLEILPQSLPVDEEPLYETIAEFYDNASTSGNNSKDQSSEGRASDHEVVGEPSNAHKFSGHTELNKRPDTLKTGVTGDGDYQAFLKEGDEYVIPVPEEAQHETPGQNETYEEPKLSPENHIYTELDVNRVHGRNTTEDGTYQKLVKQDSDYVIPAHERRESYQDIKMGRSLPDNTELDLSKRETEV